MAADLPLSTVPRWWRAGVTAAVMLVALALGSGALAATATHPTAARVVALVLQVAGLALLVERRRAPELIVGVETGIAVVAILLGGALTGAGLFFAVVVALYALATTGRPKRSVVIAGAAGLVIGGAQAYRTGNVGQLATCVVFFAAVTAVSFYVRSRRALVDSYRERAEQAVREQQWETARAVAAERVRIARELHDVIAHHVSLLVVQAGAVRETLPTDHVTRPVLDSMIDGGRHAMTELRDMLDALRFEDRAGVPPSAGASPLPLAPQPTVEEIPALVGGARSAGLPVELAVTGVPLALSPTTSMAAYRIVQEALTNAIKHAPGAPATVELAYRADALVLTVRNRRVIDTTGRLPPSTGGGYGIVGMRERATMAHGTLTVGPDLEGWKLRAWLPVHFSESAPSAEANQPSHASQSAEARADLGAG